MSAPTRWPLWLLGAGIVVLLGLWIKVFWFTEVWITAGRNEPNRLALVALHQQFNPGDSREQVLRTYYALRTDKLRLWCDSPRNWTINTPLEFGATNWMLWLEFEGDTVSAVRARTADGPPVAGSPADKPQVP